MIDSGRIAIVLEPDLLVTSTRPNNLGRIFIGKHPGEVVALVKLLFSLCGQAHSLAARQAFELPISTSDRRAVVIETLREHFTKMASGWRKLSGLESDLNQLKSIFSFFRQAGNAQQAESLLETLGAKPQQILRGTSWIAQQDSDAARLLQMLQSKGWERVGNLQPADDNEATVLAVCEDEPIMQDLLKLYGRGLFTRFYARLVHCAKLVEDLRRDAYIQKLSGSKGVETSRGLLRHKAKLHGGIVCDYHIEAPTDVNFHTPGPLMRALQVTQKTSPAQLLEKACWLVEAFDPCVPYEVRAV